MFSAIAPGGIRLLGILDKPFRAAGEPMDDVSLLLDEFGRRVTGDKAADHATVHAGGGG